MTCNRVAIINRGKVVATNTPENLMTQLTGGSGYEIEIEGEAALAKQVLQNIAGVSLVESIPTAGMHTHQPQADRAYLRVISQPGKEPGRDIATTLVRAGFGLHELRRVNATLEDVFLQLTTEEKHLEAVTEGEAA